MALTLDVREPTLHRLERRAQREGVTVDALATRLLEDAATAAEQDSTTQDPYEFIALATGGALVAENVDTALARHGFGAPRS